jgi:ABC-type multidrug transport system ATPase subunit
MMAAIEVEHIAYRYGSVTALRDLEFMVPDRALYALLGPNGSGKTTLLQILTGLRRPHLGRAAVLGLDTSALSWRNRQRIGYIAEGQPLPGWMRLEQLEAYLAPLYETWDAALAHDLRERFALDPSRRISTFSRGEHMKAALLCALAPRPRLLLMDEPFTGMDALVKDELVRGLLESSSDEGWTVMLCSHDIGELELLADWVGYLDGGTMRLSEPMDVFRERFKRVDVLLPDPAYPLNGNVPPGWLGLERAGQRVSFVLSHPEDGSIPRLVSAHLTGASRIEVRDASMREVFVALARRGSRHDHEEVAR